MVLVTRAPAEQHRKIAERIRQAVARHAIQIGGTTVSATLSLGVVSTDPGQAPPLDELIEFADRALYKAKEQGRNRVIVWKQNE